MIADDLQYVESVEIVNKCLSDVNRWNIAVSLHQERPYSLYGHCTCSKDEPGCYVDRRTSGLYKSQGQCGGTDCSKKDDKEWMEAAHSDCTKMLGCSSRCEIPPACSEDCCHDFWRCVPESQDSTCFVRSESTADAAGLQAACMKLKIDLAEPGVMKNTAYGY